MAAAYYQVLSRFIGYYHLSIEKRDCGRRSSFFIFSRGKARGKGADWRGEACATFGDFDAFAPPADGSLTWAADLELLCFERFMAGMPKLGTTLEIIEEAEKQLSIRFPEAMREVFTVSNGLEIPPDWVFYPVFDQSNPRKTASHIVHENTKSRWSYMATDLICIAGNGTGNQLVLKKEGESLSPEILVWDHETNKTRKWSRAFDYVLSMAKKRVEKIEKQINRNLKKT